MLNNKDIIIRIVLGFIVLLMFIKIVGPIIFEIIKGKLPGAYNPDNDIDSMIRRQKERLRSQYGLTTRESEFTHNTTVNTSTTSIDTPAPTKEIETLYKESRWGGGDFSKKIQNEISKNYSYTLAESKINAFILLSEKRNFLRFLSQDHQKSPDAIKSYLSSVMLFMMLIEEIRNKENSLLEKAAKKCQVTTLEFSLAIQLKILSSLKTKKDLKEDRIYTETLSLHQYSEESIKEAVDIILGQEANLWAKGHSYMMEELALYLSYANVLVPYPKFQNKKDIETAFLILNLNDESDFDEIKKTYKKIAMQMHPDKIGQMKLPKYVEKKAIEKFNIVQEAYEIISSQRKK